MSKVQASEYFCFLEIFGVGYKASTNLEGSICYLKLGFSHDIEQKTLPGVRVFCLKPTLICCTGNNLQKVSQFAAILKSLKPPEVYKGKGIRYRNEIIKKKQGKKK